LGSSEVGILRKHPLLPGVFVVAGSGVDINEYSSFDRSALRDPG
jgi:hypothetical protein